MIIRKFCNKLHSFVLHSTWVLLSFLHRLVWQNIPTRYGLSWRPWDPPRSRTTGDPPRTPTGGDTGVSSSPEQSISTTHRYFSTARPASDRSIYGPAAAAPDLEEAAPPRRSEPRLNPPAPYSGEPTSCRSFLSQCSLTFSLQPSCFPTDESRIAFVIMHLAGSAREWGTAMWDNKNECCSSYSIFSQELRKVFDRSALGNEAARALSLLRQGTRTVSDYAIEFRTLAASSGWNSRALWDHFLHGLAEHIKDEIYSLELPPSLDGLVELATRVDFRLALRSQHRNMENRHESFDLPPSARGATSPRVGFSEEEPMQIGRAHLTARERRHRIAHGLCLYCGEAGHMVTTCPYKRQPLSGERSRTVSVTAALLPSGGRTTLPAVLQSEGSPTRWQLLLTQERRGISWTLSWLDAGIFLFFL